MHIGFNFGELHNTIRCSSRTNDNEWHTYSLSWRVEIMSWMTPVLLERKILIGLRNVQGKIGQAHYKRNMSNSIYFYSLTFCPFKMKIWPEQGFMLGVLGRNLHPLLWRRLGLGLDSAWRRLAGLAPVAYVSACPLWLDNADHKRAFLFLDDLLVDD